MEFLLSCPKGGLHNDIKDLTASLLTEVCSQVIVGQSVGNPDEYSLAALKTQDGTRLDVNCNKWFWGGQSEKYLVDVRVFNPYAASNL